MGEPQPSFDPEFSGPRTHPLKAWRETQRIRDPKSRELRPMTIADAAKALGVPYHCWRGWELDASDPLSRVPNRENMRALVKFTKSQVRPDHFYDMPQLRAELAERADEAGQDE